MLIEKEWSQGHWIQKLFISLDLSAQDHSNDIKIIKIEQVKPIKTHSNLFYFLGESKMSRSFLLYNVAKI